MKSIASALVLLIVLGAIGLIALRQTQTSTPAAAAASGTVPGRVGPKEAAATAQQRATDNVAKAFEAASASRDAAETR